MSAYKLKRLENITKRGRKRSVASVNRELQLSRNIFNFARRNGWVLQNPLELGEPLISKAQETQRDRILSSGYSKFRAKTKSHQEVKIMAQ